jgi:hypothetical protein
MVAHRRSDRQDSIRRHRAADDKSGRGDGNASRNDDGAGWFVVAELAKLGLSGVTLEVAQEIAALEEPAYA